MRVIYLHGFASGPASGKAQFFVRQLAEHGIGVEVPDLAEGAFERLTISGQLAVVERVARNEAVSLIGSSLGGYLAALYASRHPEVERLVLLAPAFQALHRWPQDLGPDKMARWRESGKLAFYNYAEGGERDLNYDFVEDCARYDPAPAFSQPALLFHGTHDDVVLPRYSEEYARSHANVRLRLVASDHQLTGVIGAIWDEARPFLLGSAGK